MIDFDEIVTELNKHNDSDDVYNALFNTLDEIATQRDKAKGLRKRHIRNAGERVQDALNALDCGDFVDAIARIEQARENYKKYIDLCV